MSTVNFIKFKFKINPKVNLKEVIFGLKSNIALLYNFSQSISAKNACYLISYAEIK